MKHAKFIFALLIGPAISLSMATLTPISPFVGVHFAPKFVLLLLMCIASLGVAYAGCTVYDEATGAMAGFVVGVIAFTGVKLLSYLTLGLVVLMFAAVALIYGKADVRLRTRMLVVGVVLAIASASFTVTTQYFQYPAFDDASKYMLKNFSYGDAVVYEGNYNYERYVSRNQWSGAGESQPWDAYLGCKSTITCAEGLEDIDRVWVETRSEDAPYVWMDTKHKEPLVQNFKQTQRIKFNGHVYLYLLEKR